MRASVIAAVLLGTITNVQAAQTTTYFCSSEIEAGLTFQTGEWRSARFKEKQKFVLKTKFLRTEPWGDATLEIYNVTVTPEGTDTPAECFAQKYGLPDNPLEISAFAKIGQLTCSTLTRTYKINLKNKRFLSAYIEGYVSGDNNDDTPAFAAGKCTKIN
jgi:hypothetical protein